MRHRRILMLAGFVLFGVLLIAAICAGSYGPEASDRRTGRLTLSVGESVPVPCLDLPVTPAHETYVSGDGILAAGADGTIITGRRPGSALVTVRFPGRDLVVEYEVVVTGEGGSSAAESGGQSSLSGAESGDESTGDDPGGGDAEAKDEAGKGPGTSSETGRDPFEVPGAYIKEDEPELSVPEDTVRIYHEEFSRSEPVPPGYEPYIRIDSAYEVRVLYVLVNGRAASFLREGALIRIPAGELPGEDGAVRIRAAFLAVNGEVYEMPVWEFTQIVHS